MRVGPYLRALRVAGTGCRRRTNSIILATWAGKSNAILKRGFVSTATGLEYSPQWEPLSHFNFARDIVEKWALSKPDHTALWFTDGQVDHRVSYGELMQDVRHVATALRNRGNPTLALVILPKVLPWWVINVAGSWCGMIISPGSTMLRAHDIAFRLSQSEADCLICDPVLAWEVDDCTQNVPLRILVSENDEHIPGWVSYGTLLEEGRRQETMPCTDTKGDDIAQLFFTSGTTGYPKMVPHTQASYGMGHQLTAFEWMNLRGDDVLWNISDTGWAKAAWSSLYIPFIAGATAFVHQMPRFDASVVVDVLRNHDVSVFCAPPTAYRALVQRNLKGHSFHALRHCLSAGEPLNPEVMHAWRATTGLDIREGYGQSETTLLCATFQGMKIKEGSMGKVSPEYDVKILDDDLNEVADGIVGQLAISLRERRPPGLFKGYMKNQKQNEAAFRGDYYLTGDKAYFDHDKYLWFVGRHDDVIISAGYRIGPFEVESALQEHPAVAESAVVASPDPQRGEVVKAFIILAENEYRDMDRDQLVRELQENVKKQTAPYKYPRKIEFVESLPKTVSGKIRRVELREREWNQS